MSRRQAAFSQPPKVASHDTHLVGNNWRDPRANFPKIFQKRDSQRVDRMDCGKVVAVMPAHNESRRIGAAISSLKSQTVKPADMVVVLDQCTDDTKGVAEAHGCEVFTTFENRDKKAGALNQILRVLIPQLAADDKVLILDADSVLAPTWVEAALRVINIDASIGAVGGVFYGEGSPGLICQLQRNEYFRYARDIARRHRGAWVLTGTSTLFRVSVLRQIYAERNRSLPGIRGDFYNRSSLTEDMEITLACLKLGYRCVSPKMCVTTTELMPTWRDLWRQRLRWQRGALENLRLYGINKVTIAYFIQQAWTVACFLVILGYPTLLIASLTTSQPIVVHPIWICVGLLFFAERIATVRRAGRKGILLTISILPEFCYDLFRVAVYCTGWVDILFKREARWHHSRGR
ncbi:glycosyltransferase [Streptomyces syringium]|uniref:glycosyltransferase n=1 Tax=Streptomyces syringium TaxID=76729 RepID=UPI0033EE5578